VFDTDKIIIPVNLNNAHWVVAVVNNGKKRIEIFDSLGGGNMSLKKNLLQWLQEEHMTRRGSTLPSEWTVWSPPADSSFPRQRNGYDCGVFTCMYAWASMIDSEIDFSQADMPLFRRWMAHAITEQYLSEKEHHGGVQTPKHTDIKPGRTQLGQCGKGQNMSKEKARSEKYCALPIEGRKEENLSLDRFLDNIRRVKAGQDKMQVDETAMHVTELENTGGTKTLGTNGIDLSRTREETDPDDVPLVSAKMAVARFRENNARRTIIVDSGDEGDDNVEREGSQYQTTEQEWVKISRIVEPPKVAPRYQRRTPARRRQEFEDETCVLIRKTEEESVRFRLELEEHLNGASSITACEVTGGD
jgi:hypothetical protein